MTLLIIGLSLSFVAIGVLFYLGYQQNSYLQKRCNKLGTALIELQEEFTKYQVNQARHERDETAKREIRFDNVAKSIKKNESAISLNKKNLPDTIRETIKHIEFARPLDNIFSKK